MRNISLKWFIILWVLLLSSLWIYWYHLSNTEEDMWITIMKEENKIYSSDEFLEFERKEIERIEWLNSSHVSYHWESNKTDITVEKKNISKESIKDNDINNKKEKIFNIESCENNRCIHFHKLWERILKMFNIYIKDDFVLYIDDYWSEEPRGKMSWNSIKINVYSLDNEQEFISVMIHEIWHIIDIYYLTRENWRDLSQDFYNISWLSANEKRKGANIDDFVSWYWRSNKYEDFWESFTLFVLWNKMMKELAQENKIIEEKYNFIYNLFENTWFNMKYFENQYFIWDYKDYLSPNNDDNRVWDITKLELRF